MLVLACSLGPAAADTIPAWWDYRYPPDTWVHCGGPAHHPPFNAAAPWRALPHVLYDMIRAPLETWTEIGHALHVLLGLYAEHVEPASAERQALAGLARAAAQAAGQDDACQDDACQDVEQWLTAEELSRPWEDLCLLRVKGSRCKKSSAGSGCAACCGRCCSRCGSGAVWWCGADSR